MPLRTSLRSGWNKLCRFFRHTIITHGVIPTAGPTKVSVYLGTRKSASKALAEELEQGHTGSAVDQMVEQYLDGSFRSCSGDIGENRI